MKQMQLNTLIFLLLSTLFSVGIFLGCVMILYFVQPHDTGINKGLTLASAINWGIFSLPLGLIPGYLAHQKIVKHIAKKSDNVEIVS